MHTVMLILNRLLTLFITYCIIYLELTLYSKLHTMMLIKNRLNTKGDLSMADKNMEYISDTQTLVGTKKRELVDVETGEQIFVDQITKRVYGTKNFWKCYLMDFLTVLGIIDSKQLDVFIFIVEHTNQSNNIFLGTYDHISKEVGVCRQTIAKIMKKLQENNFIKKVQNGAWLVNPNILMRGNDTKRQILLSYYESETPINQINMTRSKRTPLPNTNKIIDTEGKFIEESEEE